MEKIDIIMGIVIAIWTLYSLFVIAPNVMIRDICSYCSECDFKCDFHGDFSGSCTDDWKEFCLERGDKDD